MREFLTPRVSLDCRGILDKHAFETGITAAAQAETKAKAELEEAYAFLYDSKYNPQQFYRTVGQFLKTKRMPMGIQHFGKDLIEYMNNLVENYNAGREHRDAPLLLFNQEAVLVYIHMRHLHMLLRPVYPRLNLGVTVVSKLCSLTDSEVKSVVEEARLHSKFLCFTPGGPKDRTLSAQELQRLPIKAVDAAKLKLGLKKTRPVKKVKRNC